MKDHAVEGELYDVSDFTRLDALEGYRPERASDSMYIRQEVNVIQGHLDDTDAVPAHVYVWNCGVMGRKFIPEGVWK
jgi:gamma-glutamylcyclotransferase (GGCT)/AIG2-like uncharacterized protein YtfP